MILEIDTSTCPEATEILEEETKYLKCAACGKHFAHAGRGRPPSSCSWIRELRKKQDVKFKKERKKARKNDNLIEVPIFDSYSSAEELQKGNIVYVLATALNREVSQRRFAKEYKVTRVEDDTVYVVRNAKMGHREYEVGVTNISRLHKIIGVDYVDKTDDDVIDEEEE